MLQDSAQLLLWLSALHNAVKFHHYVKLMVEKSLVICLKVKLEFGKSNFKKISSVWIIFTWWWFSMSSRPFFLQTWGNGGLNRGPEAPNQKQRENPSRDGAQVNPVHQLTLEAIVLQNLNQSPGAFSALFCYQVGRWKTEKHPSQESIMCWHDLLPPL